MKRTSKPTHAPLELSVRSMRNADGRLHFEGIANDVGSTDTFGTRFNWTEACLERTGEVQLLWNHNPEAPVGRGTLTRDASGNLVLDGWVSDSALTPYGVPVRDLVEQGVVKGLSVRFDNQAEYKRNPGDDFTVITPNYLPEVSITPLPSNQPSLITGTAMRMAEAVLAEMEKREDMGALVGAVRTVLEDTTERSDDPGTERAWSAPKLSDFTDKAWADLTASEKKTIKSHFLYAPADASTFGDLKLPYKDPSTGKPSLEGLKAAASRLPAADIPEATKKTIGAKIAKEMKKLGGEYTGKYAPDRSIDHRPDEARAAGPLDFATLTDRLQDAVEDAWEANHEPEPGGWTPWCSQYVAFVYDDFCIIKDWREAAWYKATYAVDNNGIVTLGAYQLVLMTWVDVQGNGENEPEPPEPAEDPGAPRSVESPIGSDELLARIRGDKPAATLATPGAEDPVASIMRRAMKLEADGGR